MQTSRQIFLLLIWQTAMFSFGQDIKKCKVKDYWVFDTKTIGQYYCVNFFDSIKSTDQRNIVIVNGFYLQCIDLFKADYDSIGLSDQKVLVKYIVSETTYMTNYYKTRLDLHIEPIEIDKSKKALLWYFKIPGDEQRQVEYQFFISTIIGARIFGLASPKFADMSIDSVKDFLTKTIKTLEIVPKTFDSKTFCDQ